jgi:hypothetical protein
MDTAALSNLLDNPKVRVDMEEKEKVGTHCNDNQLSECGVDLALKLLCVLNVAHTVDSVQHRRVVVKSWRFLQNQRKYYKLFSASSF